MAVLFFGCGDADLLRLDRVENIRGWEPSVTLPLAWADYTMWSLLSDPGTMQRDEDGQVYIECHQPGVFEVKATDLFAMQGGDMSFDSQFSLPSDDMQTPYQKTQGVVYHWSNLPEGVTLNEATISISPLSFEVANEAHVGGRLTVRFENMYSMETGENIAVTLPLTPGQPTIFSTEIPNMDVRLNGTDEVPVTFNLEVTNASAWSKGEPIAVAISFKNVMYKNVDVNMPEDFGSLAFVPNPSLFAPKVPVLEDVQGTFRFVHPEMRITARLNGIDAGFTLVPPAVDMVDGGNKLQTVDVFAFRGDRNNLGETERTFVYSAGNSNIMEFMGTWSNAAMTCKSSVLRFGGENCWISSTGSVGLDLSLRIPLALTDVDLVYYDTITDMRLSDVDRIQEAKLRIHGENGIRMSFAIPEILLLDEYNAVVGTIVNEEVESVLPPCGEETVGKGSIVLNLTADDLLNLSKCSKLVVKIKADTPEGAVAVLDDVAKLSLRIVLEAKVDMDDVVS